MNRKIQNMIVASVTFIAGLYFFLEFILPEKIGEFEFGGYHDEISKGAQLVGAMAIGLGIINLLRVHGDRILKGKRQWINSFALLLGMIVVFGVEITNFIEVEKRAAAIQSVTQLPAFLDRIYKEDAKSRNVKLSLLLSSLENTQAEISTPGGMFYLDSEHLKKNEELYNELITTLEGSIVSTKIFIDNFKNGESSTKSEEELEKKSANLKTLGLLVRQYSEISLEQTLSKKLSKFFYEGLFVALGSAMFSLLAFYVATAAYRTFRIRSLEAAIMMLAALIVMLGQIPHGPLYISEDLPAVRTWLMLNINVPAFRAISFGASIAGLAMAVRMWLSLEKSPLAVEGDQENRVGSNQ